MAYLHKRKNRFAKKNNEGLHSDDFELRRVLEIQKPFQMKNATIPLS